MAFRLLPYKIACTSLRLFLKLRCFMQLRLALVLILPSISDLSNSNPLLYMRDGRSEDRKVLKLSPDEMRLDYSPLSYRMLSPSML